MVQCLARDRVLISRDRLRNLMRRMGLRAIFQKFRTMVCSTTIWLRGVNLIDTGQLEALQQP